MEYYVIVCSDLPIILGRFKKILQRGCLLWNEKLNARRNGRTGKEA